MKFLIAVCLLAALLISGSLPTATAGQVALVGNDGNIYQYDIASGTTTPLTQDAVLGEKGYSWPTWANDGRLAYFGFNRDGDDPYRLGIFVRDTSGNSQRVYASPDEIFTYAYWSPGDCLAGGCRDLAVLYTMSSGNLGLRRVRVADEISVDELAEGSPFYWDWSPDGQTMLWARYRTRFELYDVAAEEVVFTFPEQQGLQRSVDWSPVDDRLLAAVTTDRHTSDLVVFDDEARLVLADDIEGIVSFEWSPDGTLVAYADDDGGTLRIVDAQTGQIAASPSDNSLAFFWSPDGTQVAYISLTRAIDVPARRDQQGQPKLQWFVYDLATKSAKRLSSFVPTDDMIYYLSFYDQFARSHRLWSPDSRYLVYGERVSDGSSVVSLVDATQPGIAPQIIGEGTLGIFNW